MTPGGPGANHPGVPSDASRRSECLRRHAALLHRVARAYGRDAAEREDLVQEMALALWRSLTRLDLGRRESTWVYRVALNVAISHARRERRHRAGRLADDGPLFTVASPAALEPGRGSSGCRPASPSWASSSGPWCSCIWTATTTPRSPRCSGSPCPTWVRGSSAPGNDCAPRWSGARAPRIDERRTDDMRLDDLERAWTAHGAALERSLALDERILRELLLRRARFALGPFVLFRALEVALGLLALLVLAPVLLAHRTEPRYLLVGGAVLLFALGLTIQCAGLLARTLQLDASGPVLAIQRQVEHLKRCESRATKWALLGGVFLWLPGLLLLVEVPTGIPALGRVELAFLLGNLGLGLVVLVVGQVWSRRVVERPDLSPLARRVVDALASGSLHSAARHLDELARFERE